MAVRKFSASGADDGKTLSRFLAELLDLPLAAATERIEAGGAYVDGRRVEDPAAVVRAGARVAFYPEQAERAPQLVVVHEAHDCVVIDKPAGMPSQATRSGVRQAADRLVRSCYPRARPFHRLDQDASGLLLFTMGAPAHRRFRAHLDGRRLKRRYRALVWGQMADDSGRIDRAIGPDPRDRRRQAVGVGKPAVTRYRVLRRGHTGRDNEVSLVELSLETGRQHQIRVHLASLGFPICGDSLYGLASEPEPVDRLALVSSALEWPGQRVERDTNIPLCNLATSLIDAVPAA